MEYTKKGDIPGGSVHERPRTKIYAEHASMTHALPEGEPLWARGAGDLGPAKAASPALVWSVTAPLAALESCGLNLLPSPVLHCVQ